ncbi:MAG: SDR family NAD(P)-dependent oxidoreductase [Hydrogenophaga sp.]
MNPTPRIVIVGATSAMAEHCARLWIHQPGVHLTLLGRDLARTERVAADLRVRNPQASVHAAQTHFTDPAAIQSTVDGLAKQGRFDVVLIAHGSLPNQNQCEQNLEQCQDALVVNGVSPVLFAEAFAQHLARANHGTLAIIGSVAGDRGRKSNYVYGAAKGLVTRYVQGLQHRFAGTMVKVVLIKPGPTDTPMTAHLKGQGAKLASVQQVAAETVKAIASGQATLYTPKPWFVVMMVVRHLPSFVFNKLNI